MKLRNDKEINVFFASAYQQSRILPRIARMCTD